MDDNKFYTFLSIVLIILILGIIFLIFTVDSSESFTELYFEDSENLPSTIELGEEYEFQFSIHNLEQETKEYLYNIYLEIDGEEQTLDQEYITLSFDQTATISGTFTITEEFSSAKVIVETNDQEIHFWVEVEE